MKIRNNYLIYLFILFIVVILSHYNWFFNFQVITSGDWLFHHTESMKEWFSLPYSWNSQSSLGDYVGSPPFYGFLVVAGMLAKLNIGYNLIERIVFFWPATLLSAFGMFFLSRRLFANNKASFIAALVYSTNTYFLLILGGHLTVGVAYALLPFVFYFFLRAVDNFELKSSILSGLILSFIFVYEPRMGYIISLLLMAYSVFSINFHNLKKYISNIFLTFMIVFLIHSFWIIPSFTVKFSDTQALFAPTPWISYMKMEHALYLSHPFWTGEKATEFLQMPVGFSIIIYPFLAFAALLLIRKSNENRKLIIFLAAVALVAIFLVKQENPPFGEIYTSLFNYFPGFNMFREASKFYMLVAFSFALLTAFLISQVKNSRITSIVLIIVVAILLYNAKPAFTTELGRTYKITQVPEQYLIFKNFIYDQNEFFRTYWYPLQNRFAFYSNQHPAISHAPSLNREGLQTYYKSASNYLFLPESNTFYNLLDALSVKYLIVPLDSENDTYRHYGDREKYIQKIQENYPKLIQTDITNNITVFENPTYQDHFYIINDFYQPISKPKENSSTLSEFQSICVKTPLFEATQIEPVFTFREGLILNSKEKAKEYSGPRIQDAFTLSACVFPSANQKGSGDIVAKRRDLTHVDYGLIYLFDNNTNKINFGASLNNGRNLYFFDRNQFPVEKWYSLTAIYDETSLKLYVDGTLVSEIKASGTLSSSDAPLSIGKMYGFESWFNGSINAVKLYDEVLGQKDLLSLANDCKELEILTTCNNEPIGVMVNPNEKNTQESTVLSLDNDTYGSLFSPQNLSFTEPFGITLKATPKFMNQSGEILAKRQGYLTEYSLLYAATPDGISFGMGTYAGLNHYAFESLKRPFDQEYFLTFTYHEDHVNLYVNGDLSKQIKLNKSITLLYMPLTIGKSTLNGAHFTGVVENIKFYNHSLTSYEVKSLYDPSFAYNKSKIENFDRIEKTKVQYKFINPTKYKVNISSSEPFMLSFAESYDPLWVAYDREKTIKVNSIPLYSVINGFYINKTGNYELIIEYTPQRYFYIGSMISITTLILLISYLIYDYIRNRQKKTIKKPETEGHPYHETIKNLFMNNKIGYNEALEYLMKSYNKKESYQILKDWRTEKEINKSLEK